MRWRVVCVSFLLLLTPWASFAEPLRFGYTPVFPEAEMRAEFEPVNEYLSEAIGRSVTLFIAKSYGDLRAEMEAGRVDLGSFSPFAYVDAARGAKITLIAQSILDNSAFYRGVIIVRRDRGIAKLADLEGRRFAFVDAKSASGYVYPRAMLIEKGLDPAKFFREAVFGGNHGKVVAMVLRGEVDGGATYDGALPYAKGQGERVEDLAVIAETDPIPHDAITVRADLDPALAAKVQAALVAFAASEKGKAIIARSKKKLSGYVVAEDAKFEVVRRTARIAGLLP